MCGAPVSRCTLPCSEKLITMDFLVKVLAVIVVIIETTVESAPRIRRLSVAESPPTSYIYNNIQGNSGTYSFNYDISDSASGNTQYRSEDRYPNGTVTGAYGYIDPYGTPQRFRYIADKAGYRVFKDFFRPNYPTTMRPMDKVVNSPTEPEITWTRPKRPNKKGGNKNKTSVRPLEEKSFVRPNQERRQYNLIGPPSFHIPH